MFLTRGMAPRAMDDRSPFGNFWFEPVSVRTQSGIRVSADAAMRLSAVFACVRVLSETFAVLPFGLFRREGARKIAVTDHWLVKLMRRPNPWQNGFEWREMMQGHLALRGNAFNRVTTNSRGEITELWPMHPDRVKIEMLPSGDYRYRFKQPDGTDTVYTRADVWHLRGLSSDGIIGLSPLEVARETIGLGIAAQEYGARFFQNDARPGGGWIEFPGSFKDKGARETFRETWQGMQSGGNRHKTAVLEFGMKYHELGIKNNDAQFLETRQFQVTDIARVFRMPPHLIGDLSRSTNNNIEQQSLEFVTFTMTPWAERWEAAIETDLLLEDDGLEVEFDFAGLLRGDQAARAEFYTSGITNGWLTRNEARASENLNPIDGLDEPLVPLNMQTQDQAERAELEPLPDGDEGGKAPPAAPAPDARLLALASSAAERVARREFEVISRAVRGTEGEGTRRAAAAAYADHAAFVAKCMNVPLEAAKAYCAARLTGLRGNEEIEEFESLARSQLERLALTGSAS